MSTKKKVVKKVVKKVPEFPAEIYVTVGNASIFDEPFLNAEETLDLIRDGSEVAVYELVSTHKLKVRHELEGKYNAYDV